MTMQQARAIAEGLASGLAFIGGGNMADALGSRLIPGRRCAAQNIHVIDPVPAALAGWRGRGCTTAAQADAALSAKRVWVLAVKPQHMQEAVLQCRTFLQPDTLVISIAAGITSLTLGQWLGSARQPWQRVVRAMPNTPALIGEGITGLWFAAGVTEQDRAAAEALFETVGQCVWLDSEAQLNAVTALSGSGPAYVFLFIEALMRGGVALGLSEAQARHLAVATVAGAAELADRATEPPAVLRERVTSKGGTTAAALQVFAQQGWTDTVHAAMLAAHARAGEMAKDAKKEVKAAAGATQSGKDRR